MKVQVTLSRTQVTTFTIDVGAWRIKDGNSIPVNFQFELSANEALMLAKSQDSIFNPQWKEEALCILETKSAL